MTGHVGDVEKFPLCEFRFYDVLPPEKDTPSLSERRYHFGIGKKRQKSALRGEFVAGECLLADG